LAAVVGQNRNHRCGFGIRKSSSFKCTESKENILEQILNRISSYHRVLRVTAYVLWAFNKIPASKNLCVSQAVEMPATELQHSFLFIEGIIQHQTYWKEIDCLKMGKVLSADLQRLTPFLSESAIGTRTVILICVGGRLENAQIPVKAKYPLLLPKDHKFTYKLVEFLHQTNMHAGPKALIGILRLQVWIVNSRRLVSKVVRNCVHCYHYKPNLLDHILGSFPADR